MSKAWSITRAQAVAVLGRSDRWFGKLKREGYWTPDARGRYDLRDVFAGLEAYYRDQEAAAAKRSATTCSTEARTREINLRVAHQEQKLVPIDDALAYVEEFAADVAAEVVGFADRVGDAADDAGQAADVASAFLAALAERGERTGLALRTGGPAILCEGGA